jgi:hypothetical protein
MAIYKVTKVRKEAPSLNPNHKHIVGVVTEDGVYHSNQVVVDSLASGDSWWTSVPDEPEAEIIRLRCCPQAWCLHAPYLASVPGESLASDLERLPPG